MRCVGIDLGGTAIKAGAVSSDGRILDRRSAATGLERGERHVLDTIAALARELGVEGGLGLGVPGLIDRERGCITECPNLKAMERVPLRDELARRLGLDLARVLLENDANAAAAGEHWLGTGRGERDLLFVTLGTGVGGGLILDGRLYAGPGGLAGEIGHVVVEPGGPVCGCGSRGCVEMFASATAATRRARELGLPREKPGDLAQLARIAREREGAERELLHAVGRDLGRALATVVSLLDVRTFVLGGGFGAATDLLTPGVLAGIRERSYGERLATVRVLPAVLGADAGWIGAARPLAP
ncbi:MAG: ROK family protein [Planctomycetes bacterium]|nr:ROK family protein [Planctomycetota bacterium]